MSEALIDAGKVLDARDRDRPRSKDDEPGEDAIRGERGPASLNSARKAAPRGSRAFFGILGILVGAIVVVLLVKAHRTQEEADRPRASGDRIEKRVPALKLAPRSPETIGPAGQLDQEHLVSVEVTGVGEPVRRAPGPAVDLEVKGEVSTPSPDAHAVPPGEPTARESVLDRRLSRGFGATAFGEGEEVPPSPQGTPPAVSSARVSSGSLEEKLEATTLLGTSATVMKDRDHWLTQGAMLDCVLETRIVSTVAGMTSCHLTRDAYSTNGRVVLLDRGTRLVGRFQGGMQQGDARVFVVWTRAETPNGVVVTLDSPGTGALGEAGVGGWTDRHFWDRFGAAILVSLVQSGTDAAAARVAGSASHASISVDGPASATKDVIGRTYDSTIGMAPTLYVNQGERIGIFVARDLNFRSVYGLELVGHEGE